MSPPMTIFKRINDYISKEFGGFTHEDQVVRSHIPQLGFLRKLEVISVGPIVLAMPC